MKCSISFLCILTLAGLKVVRAQGGDPFATTTSTVGWQTNGFETPDNQFLTPAGRLVALPGVRPNALALSPDGKWLATSGMQPELIMVDTVTGTIRQRVAFPSDQQLPPLDSVSKVVPVLNLNPKDKLSFTGIAFSPDGRRIYLSNVGGDIKVFGVGKDGQASALFSIPLPPVDLPDRKMDIPTGLALSPDGKKVYVALNVANRVLELDAATGRMLRRWDVGCAPFGVALCEGKLYVSNWGGRRPGPNSLVGAIGRNGTVRVDQRSIASEGSVSVIDLESDSGAQGPSVEILTGRHACALALSPNKRFLACANAGDDTISIIDTRADKIVETLCARQNRGDLFGAQPDALTFDRRGKRLFVCNGSQNAVAVFAFKAGASRLLGLIPVGWFPGAIACDARHAMIDVANLTHFPSTQEPAQRRKGHGAGFNSKQWFGSLSLAPIPSGRELERFTRAALANLRYPLLAKSKLPAREDRQPQPVPERVGEPSVFQHVIYFIKENRSYDQVLGDVAEGDGAAELCVFGQRITPNQHKLVREFTLLDNTYCSGIMSADGHQWTDSAIANEYVQRSFNGWPRSYPGGGADPHGRDALAYSSAGFIWDDALAHGKTVADFGEFTTAHHSWKASGRGVSNWTEMYRDFTSGSNAIAYLAEPDLESLRHCFITNYVGFDLNVPDVVRAAQFIQALKGFEGADDLPQLLIVWLPDDHTSGTRSGSPTPGAQVADNDLAFGQIVDAVSHSKFWRDTCIFAIEDDPQDGWDHVSGYRTTAYVASPYTRRHAVVHTQYNHTSLLRTIELILGLPPMNQMDATATPMFDCFTNTPDFTSFNAAANQVALDEMNPNPRHIKDAQLRRDAYVSARLPLDKEDQCPEDVFNHILWRAAKGSHTPYPDWAVSVMDDD